ITARPSRSRSTPPSSPPRVARGEPTPDCRECPSETGAGGGGGGGGGPRGGGPPTPGPPPPRGVRAGGGRRGGAPPPPPPLPPRRRAPRRLALRVFTHTPDQPRLCVKTYSSSPRPSPSERERGGRSATTAGEKRTTAS